MIQFDEHIFQMGWNHQPDKHPDPDICLCGVDYFSPSHRNAAEVVLGAAGDLAKKKWPTEHPY